MENFSAGHIGGSSASEKDNSKHMIFDATQYEFFGKNVIEDELEKLEGEMDDIVPFKGFEYETFPSSESDKDKGVMLSTKVDLVTAFTKLFRSCEPSPGFTIESLPSLGPVVVPQTHRRWTGTIKWFSNQRSYGFITPSNGGEDIFVHYSSVKSNGYIHLWAGTNVEFEIVGGHEGKLQAINMTGPGGTLLQDRRRRRSIASSSNGVTRPFVGPCYECGKMGHIARNCFRTRKIAAWPGFGHTGWNMGFALCYCCGQLGHLASNCPYVRACW